MPVKNYVSTIQIEQRKRDSRTASEVLAGDSVTLSEVSVVSLLIRVIVYVNLEELKKKKLKIIYNNNMYFNDDVIHLV